MFCKTNIDIHKTHIRKLQEKIFAIEAVDIDVDAWILLEYLKNEYAQVEILDELDKFIEKTEVKDIQITIGITKYSILNLPSSMNYPNGRR